MRPRACLVACAITCGGCAWMAGPCTLSSAADGQAVSCNEGGRLVIWRLTPIIEAAGKLQRPPGGDSYTPVPAPPTSPDSPKEGGPNAPGPE